MSKREVTVIHNQTQEAWIRKHTILLLRGFNSRKYSIEEYIRIWDSFVSCIETYLTSHPNSSFTEIYWNLSRENDSKRILLSRNGKIVKIDM